MNYWKNKRSTVDFVTPNGDLATIYHETAIYTKNRNTVTLNSGGWETVTTKRRINQCFERDNLPYKVYQKVGIWYVYDANTDNSMLFRDGMVLSC